LFGFTAKCIFEAYGNLKRINWWYVIKAEKNSTKKTTVWDPIRWLVLQKQRVIRSNRHKDTGVDSSKTTKIWTIVLSRSTDDNWAIISCTRYLELVMVDV
jgi:hypothetical protein